VRTHPTRLRAVLVMLLVGSGLLFAIGSTIERHQHHNEQSGTTASSRDESGSGEKSGESGGESSSGESLTILAVVASLLLSFAVWLGRWPRLTLLLVAGFGLLFAAGDARELAHQLDESNADVVAIAAILTGLHLAVSVFAAMLYPCHGGPQPYLLGDLTAEAVSTRSARSSTQPAVTRSSSSRHPCHPQSWASRRSAVEMPLLTSSTVVESSDSEKESSMSCSLEGWSLKVQVITSRCGRSISVYSPLASTSVPSGFRITTRTFPPTRRSTSASGVSQSGAQWSQRRITSGLVHASKTSSAEAAKVRSIRTT
jgi:hypothetical protein